MKRTLFLLAALLPAAACGTAPAFDTPAVVQPAQAAYVPDPHSFAQPAEAAVRHVHLDLSANFVDKVLAGTATLTLERAPGADDVVLDAKNLDIRRVTDGSGSALRWSLGEEREILGRPLTVELPAGVDRIVVHYATRPDAAALQWLDPAQTAGGRHPYLFTQGQAILTRTWVPTQDSPGIRQTYSARIVVPRGLRAVMSAEDLTPNGVPVEGGTAYEFRLEQPVPAYLFALAIGDIAFRAIGPRTGVFSEPSVVDSAAREFADVERMVEAAERLYGPYRWGRYDILVLPPSFPFGGMENPRLTFATPTILAGDKSLVSLIAHELAHSWSGNLVTNAVWNDFWLNEGFTTYFENRIMEAIYGDEVASMLRVLGRQDLTATLEEMGANAPDSRLHVDLTGRDPDAGVTSIAYEKGAAFLHTLEHVVGRERFDAFLRQYFDAHAFQPMTSRRFLDYLRRELFRGDSALEARVRPEEWIYGTGLPSNAVVEQSDRFAQAEAQARAFAGGTPATQLATQNWTTQEWLHFLRSLPAQLTPAQMAGLDRAFGFTATGNSEVLFQWLRTAIRTRYEPALPALERFLATQGRRKFILPLFTDLMAHEWSRDFARRVYARARPTYHAVTRNSVDEVMGGG